MDAKETMTADNWILRSTKLVGQNGQHSLDTEPRLEALFDADLSTPNDLHCVPNHGSVPKIYWDTHEINVCDDRLELSMDDTQRMFAPINLLIALPYDGLKGTTQANQ